MHGQQVSEVLAFPNDTDYEDPDYSNIDLTWFPFYLQLWSVGFHYFLLLSDILYDVISLLLG